MTGSPAGSSDPKTSFGQSIQRHSSQRRHVVSAASVFGQRGCDRFGDALECGQIFGRHLIEQSRQCGTPKCEYPPKRTPAWTMAAAKRCLDGEKKNQLLSRAAFRTTRPAADDRAVGDRLNDEEAAILPALLGKLYKSWHDDG